jgi:hypothetical protein
MPTKDFNFESYAIQQLDAINKKLDGLNVQYMPREEIYLRLTEVMKTLATLTDTVAQHTSLLSALKSTDDKQQGSIDASRRTVTTGWTIAGLLLTSLFIYVSWRVGAGR